MKIRIFFALLLTFFCFDYLKAEDYIRINDTNITRGGVHLVPVFTNIDFAGAESVDLLFRFNSNVLDIKRFIGTGNSIIQDESLEAELNLLDLDNATAKIYSENIRSNGSNLLGFLEIEGLVYRDSTTNLQAIRLIVSRETRQDVNFIAGLITVSGLPIVDSEAEWLGFAAPNPFTYYADFRFAISRETNVNFDIFDYYGRRIVSYPKNDTDEINFFLFDDNGSIISDTENYRFSVGEYRLRLHPQGLYLKAGPYYLIMRTTQGVYQSNFFYIK